MANQQRPRAAVEDELLTGQSGLIIQWRENEPLPEHQLRRKKEGKGQLHDGRRQCQLPEQAADTAMPLSQRIGLVGIDPDSLRWRRLDPERGAKLGRFKVLGLRPACFLVGYFA
jgi:hypothetical protein